MVKKGMVIFLIGSIAGLYQQTLLSIVVRKQLFIRLLKVRIELSGSRVKLTEISPGRTKTSFGDNIFSTNKMKKFMSGFQLLDPDDISNALLFALDTKWKKKILV